MLTKENFRERLSEFESKDSRFERDKDSELLSGSFIRYLIWSQAQYSDDLTTSIFNLQFVIIEIYLRSERTAEELKRVKQFDQRDSERRLTPDLGEGVLGQKAVEFKVSMFPLTSNYVARRRAEIEEKYGKEVLPIILDAEGVVKSSKKLTSRQRNLLLEWIGYIRNDISDNPGTRDGAEYVYGVGRVPLSDEILIKKIKGLPEIPEWKEPAQLEDILRGFGKESLTIESFINKNYMKPDDLSKICLPERIPTVSADHPFDRDFNREFVLLQRPNADSSELGKSGKRFIEYPLFKSVEGNDEIPDNFPPIQKEIFISMLNRDEVTASKNSEAANDILSAFKKIDEIYESEAFTAIRENAVKVSIIKTNAKITGGESKKKELSELESDTEEHKRTIEDATGIKLDNNGAVSLKSFAKKQEEDVIASYLRISKEGKLVGDHKSCLEANTDEKVIKLLASYMERLSTVSVKLPKDQTFYRTNPELERLTQELFKSGSYMLSEITSTPTFGFLWNMMGIYRGISAALPPIMDQKNRISEMAVYRHKGFNLWVLSTRPPNELTHGANVWLAKSTEDLREWFHCFKVSEGWYMSFPFRPNLKVSEQWDERVAAYVGSSVCLRSYSKDGSYRLSPLFESLFWEHRKQLTQVTDIIYQMFKNVFAVGTLGRLEGPTKYEDLNYSDLRVSAIADRLQNKFGSFFRDCQNAINDQQKRQQTRKGLLDLVDPVFDLKIDHIQNLLFIIYLKQIYPKNDGLDKEAMLGNFLQQEIKFQKWYEDSDLRNSFEPDHWSQSTTDAFIRHIFNPNGEWAKIGYNDGIARACILSSLKRYKEKKGEKVKLNRLVSINTGKNSKVLMPTKMLRKGGQEEDSKSKPDDVFKSMVLTDALLYTEDECRLMYNSLLTDEEKKYYSCRETEALDLLERVVAESHIHPPIDVVSMVVKEQVGPPSKRVFFLMTLPTRNRTKLMEETLRQILDYVGFDMIHVPGNKKLVLLEEAMARVNPDEKLTTNFSNDISKFGDTYPLEALKLVPECLFHEKLISKEVAQYMLWVLELIGNRLILVPKKTESYLKESLKKDAERNHTKVYIREKVWLDFRENISKLNDSRNWLPVTLGTQTQTRNWGDVEKRMTLKKNVGFTLGVFNFLGSFMADGVSALLNDASIRMGLSSFYKTESYSQSDDSVTFTDAPVVKSEIFTSTVLSETEAVVDELLSGAVALRSEKSVVIARLERNGGVLNTVPVVVWDMGQIVKFFFAFSLLLFRASGERNNLFKLTFGPYPEVLQTYFMENKALNPVGRSCVTLGKNLDGQSYAQDVYSVVGRLYTAILDGLPPVGASALQIYISVMLSRRFGINIEDLDADYPPQLFGLWFNHPGLVRINGFSTNLARILLNSLNTSDEKDVRKAMTWMMRDDSVWRKSPEKTEIGTDEIDVFITDNEEADSEKDTVVDLFNDFLITFGRNQASLGQFSFLAKKFFATFSGSIDQVVRENKITEFESQEEGDRNVENTKKVLLLKEATQIQKLVIRNSPFQKGLDNLVSYLSKRKQSSFRKIPQSTILIATMGWAKRTIVNPFKSSITRAPQENMEVQAIVKFIRSAESFPRDGETYERLDVMFRLYSEHIAVIKNLDIKINGEVERSSAFDLSSTFSVVKEYSSTTFDPKTLNFLYAFVVETEILKRSKYDTLVSKINPFLLESPQFLEQVSSFKALLGDRLFGVSKSSFIDGVLAIDKVLRSQSMNAVMKIESGDPLFSAFLSQATAFRMKTGVVVSKQVRVKYGKRSVGVSSRVARVLMKEILMGKTFGRNLFISRSSLMVATEKADKVIEVIPLSKLGTTSSEEFDSMGMFRFDTVLLAQTLLTATQTLTMFFFRLPDYFRQGDLRYLTFEAVISSKRIQIFESENGDLALGLPKGSRELRDLLIAEAVAESFLGKRVRGKAGSFAISKGAVLLKIMRGQSRVVSEPLEADFAVFELDSTRILPAINQKYGSIIKRPFFLKGSRKITFQTFLITAWKVGLYDSEDIETDAAGGITEDDEMWKKVYPPRELSNYDSEDEEVESNASTNNVEEEGSDETDPGITVVLFKPERLNVNNNNDQFVYSYTYDDDQYNLVREKGYVLENLRRSVKESDDKMKDRKNVQVKLLSGSRFLRPISLSEAADDFSLVRKREEIIQMIRFTCRTAAEGNVLMCSMIIDPLIYYKYVTSGVLMRDGKDEIDSITFYEKLVSIWAILSIPGSSIKLNKIGDKAVEKLVEMKVAKKSSKSSNQTEEEFMKMFKRGVKRKEKKVESSELKLELASEDKRLDVENVLRVMLSSYYIESRSQTTDFCQFVNTPEKTETDVVWEDSIVENLKRRDEVLVPIEVVSKNPDYDTEFEIKVREKFFETYNREPGSSDGDALEVIEQALRESELNTIYSSSKSSLSEGREDEDLSQYETESVVSNNNNNNRRNTQAEEEESDTEEFQFFLNKVQQSCVLNDEEADLLKIKIKTESSKATSELKVWEKFGVEHWNVTEKRVFSLISNSPYSFSFLPTPERTDMDVLFWTIGEHLVRGNKVFNLSYFFERKRNLIASHARLGQSASGFIVNNLRSQGMEDIAEADAYITGKFPARDSTRGVINSGYGNRWVLAGCVLPKTVQVI